MRLALLQMNPLVGDLQGNAAKISAGVRESGNKGADLVITPELALLGYPPRDLLLIEDFIKESWEVLESLAGELKEAPPVLLGLAEENPSQEGRPLFNTAVLLDRGRVGPRFRKSLLPTYDVFDEDRYFEPAKGSQILEFRGLKLGVTVCEDVWNDRQFWPHPRYHADPTECFAREGVGLMVNLSASPFSVGKQERRERMLSAMAARSRLQLAYINLVGGNDDLVFDGRSSFFNDRGELLARGRGFEEDLLLVDLDPPRGEVAEDDFRPEAEVWRALVLGTKDYAAKCGFKKAVVGLSGGVDSSLTAAVAAEALGPEAVLGVLMPSPFSSQGSIDDALTLAGNLRIRTLTLPIHELMAAFEESLAPAFQGFPRDVTEENIQARIRGNLLMSISNKHGSLLLTTGNKSELAVGYCTLYGDMSGGLAVISDVPKTMIYRVSAWLNQARGREVIPPGVLTKPPSAELRPDQTDQDSLPPYDLLDRIIRLHIEERRSAREIVKAGFEGETVREVLRLVRLAEFKRKQAAPGLKVTDRAFGTGWRMPIARR